MGMCDSKERKDPSPPPTVCKNDKLQAPEKNPEPTQPVRWTQTKTEKVDQQEPEHPNPEINQEVGPESGLNKTNILGTTQESAPLSGNKKIDESKAAINKEVSQGKKDPQTSQVERIKSEVIVDVERGSEKQEAVDARPSEMEFANKNSKHTMKLDVTPINMEENDPYANFNFLNRTPDIIAPRSSITRKSKKAQ